MKVTVSGLYRHDLLGHTEQGLKEYSETFEVLKKKDSTFDSLKTHKVKFLLESDPVEDFEDAKPTGSETEPTGEDSGTELFE